jgi:hypothetical protein
MGWIMVNTAASDSRINLENMESERRRFSLELIKIDELMAANENSAIIMGGIFNQRSKYRKDLEEIDRSIDELEFKVICLESLVEHATCYVSVSSTDCDRVSVSHHHFHSLEAAEKFKEDKQGSAEGPIFIESITKIQFDAEAEAPCWREKT